MARNFKKRHGAAALRSLIAAFEACESGQKIADRMSVTRERVRQWRDAFGYTVTSYMTHPEVLVVLNG